MEKNWRKILIVTNIVAFAFGAIVYYFAFDIRWGVTTTAITWGVPLALTSLFALTASIIVWKRKQLKWGLFSLGIIAAALIYMGIMLHFFSWVLLPQQEEQHPQSEEDKVLALVLTERFNKDGDYSVISPFTVFPDTELDTVKERLNIYSCDFTELINRFFELNDSTVSLSLNSSPSKGYYVDYKGIFSKYIEHSGGTSLRWLLFHPQASGYVSISMPAYDSETGYFLIYIGYSSVSYHHPGGSGDILLYKYEDGKVTLVDIVPVWIS